MLLDLSSLRKAVQALKQLAERTVNEVELGALDETILIGLQAGVIQHFEFTYELSWKFMQRWIRLNVSPEDADNPRSRKDLFRHAARLGLIEDPARWFSYAEARNLTSHTYDDHAAESVYETAIKFVRDAESLVNELERRND
ncbi:MAG: nucleotidyltransferase [bacterium]|nr:nucleotidyltransferase [bacterium]